MTEEGATTTMYCTGQTKINEQEVWSKYHAAKGILEEPAGKPVMNYFGSLKKIIYQDNIPTAERIVA